MPQRLIVGITGATGAVYAYELLRRVRELGGIETHLVMSSAAVLTARQELGRERAEFEALATEVHNVKDIGASIASGSFVTAGMVVVPCSMKTLAAVAHGFSENLISRAADVVLKQRRRLVLVTRETPLNLAHIRNMEAVTLMGGVIFPPVPAFYANLRSLEDLVTHTVGRVLDLFEIEHRLVNRWRGLAETLKDGGSADAG
jgi:polyprenyl P-hydroxybenzoate/phenylacrylic acid decarboxylase-like protein